MAYYLGYRKDGELRPIDLNIENANDILSIVNFTCSFENEEQFMEYLSSEDLIPLEDVELVYLIEKGKKGSKIYNELPNVKEIFYYCSSNNFNIEKIKNYLERNSHDSALIKYLLSNLLKKYGIIACAKRFFIENIKTSSRREYLISVLETLSTHSSSINLNCKLSKLIDSIKSESNFIEMSVEDLMDLLNNDNESLVYFYRLLKKHLKFPKLLAVDDLLKLEYMIEGYHLNKTEQTELIERFVNHCIFNGTKMNSRNLVDLGIIIHSYKEYIIELEIQNYKPFSNINEEYDERDEFLEESDFTRIDMTSESAGIRLRPTDSTRWGENN